MLGVWYGDLESLEAINQNADTRDVLLRMAGLARGGRLGSFMDVVHADAELDEHTKAWLYELARDQAFLLAVEDYLLRCRHYH
jgi:hypothetical protein